MNCHACDKSCSDAELKQDLVGWREFKPMCRKCLKAIKGDSLISPDSVFYTNYDPSELRD